MRTIKRDPFARQELQVALVKAAGRTCGFCGSQGDRNGNLRQFYVERDDRPGRPDKVRGGLFCSASCMRDYNS